MIDEIALAEDTPGRCAVTHPSLAENSNGELVSVWARYWVTEKEHCGDICSAQIRSLMQPVRTTPGGVGLV